jgi:hypothetical protein
MLSNHIAGPASEEDRARLARLSEDEIRLVIAMAPAMPDDLSRALDALPDLQRSHELAARDAA